MKGIVREPEVETATEAQMRLFVTMEGISFDLSSLVLKVLLQFQAESGNSSSISGF